jgi:hypothetical protein
MAANRKLMITGGVILIVVLLIGAFSLGVYIGRYGASAEGLHYQAANGVPQIDRSRLTRPAGIPEGEPDVVGLVRRSSRDGLQLATQQGPKWIEMDPNTSVMEISGSELNLKDLHPRDIIAVFGEFSVDDGSTLLATHIVRLPQR